LYVGGSGPGNYSKIQDAVDNASEGDTVFVYSGFYEENILISTSIQLIGIENNSTIIDGGSSNTVVTIVADNTVLLGFTIQNAQNDIPHAGIEISTANNVQILRNIIQDNGMLGISIQGPNTQGTRILTNTIRNNSYGVYLFNSPNTLILANNICDNGEGMYIVGSYASLIMNNTVANRGLGVHLESTYGVVVNGNKIVNNANGVYAFNSSKISITDNLIGWNRWYGLWTKDASDNIVYGNTISNNIDVGLFLESSFDTTVTNNTIWDNDNGIYLKDSAGNLIQKNNLRNNKVNGCFVAHTLIHRRNIWKMNYWERARLLPYPVLGYIKLEKITISWINVDWTPLRQPPQSSIIKKLANEGNILYVGGNGPNNYSSIQAAINDAHHNDTIYVFNGTYYEAVLINKSLQLIGENKTTTILEGNGTRDIITIIADYVTVNGFTIQNGHFNILVNHSSYGNITGNMIGSGLHGISVQNECRFITISKNSFLENVYGVRLFSSTDVTISYNNLYSFKINAFYFGTSLAHGRHHWYNNYWEEPRYLPYIIHGKIRLGNFSLIWFNVDWSPRISPY
jgi:parallel beta-helix repeat protein